MQTKIIEKLLKMGVPTNLKGFNLLIDAVQITLDNPNLGAWALYNKLADKHQSSPNKVERNLRHAINNAMYIKEELPYLNGRLNNGNVISNIAQTLKIS